MNTGEVVLRTRSLYQNGIRQQNIKDGSKVLVRIIADKGNGRYEGSIAGSKANLFSQKTLTPGTSFTAKVSLKNGVVTISPEMVEKSVISDNIIVKEFGVEEGQILQLINDGPLARYMNALGLIPDNLSLNLLQQLKQMEMKFNPQLIKRIRNLSVNFAGKEKSASEILMTLAQKGIDFSEEELWAMILQLESYSEGSPQKSQKGDFELLNKINAESGSWFFLPFEIQNLKSETITGSGIIRFLMQQKTVLKQLNLECTYNGSSYLFNLDFSGKKCVRIRMNIRNEEVEQKESLEELKRLFLLRGQNVKIEWDEVESLKGSGCFGNELKTVGGLI